jgi:hypothetical protein
MIPATSLATILGPAAIVSVLGVVVALVAIVVRVALAEHAEERAAGMQAVHSLSAVAPSDHVPHAA